MSNKDIVDALIDIDCLMYLHKGDDIILEGLMVTRKVLEKNVFLKPDKVFDENEMEFISFCPKCGTELFGKFCSECGQRIEVWDDRH